ncbi:cupredoxin domain-containing protein [Lacticaseibacillus parakribbianus]|uniref:cupredoxin domain-containing protein n=1 Tax=Lacticaseibacillus parakribbianus TaxID=2970927 RepID=UPI0021CAE723|nr:cupredoxin domain-containing protein [Lacticaseibacillus parakribbianus]
MSEASQNVNIEVAGGYQPQVVVLKAGVPATLTFNRTSAQGCLDVVHSQQLGFETALPLNQPQTVALNTTAAGEYDFSCGMDMFHGKVVIR